MIDISLGEEREIGPAATTPFGPSEQPGHQVRRQESQVTPCGEAPFSTRDVWTALWEVGKIRYQRSPTKVRAPIHTVWASSQ